MINKYAFLTILLLGLVCGCPVNADDQDLTSNEQSSTGLYYYDENNPPEVFFFPKEKAKWDGSKVTMREWYMLTEKQKEKYLDEYLQDLKAKNNVTIDIVSMEYLKALNAFSAYSNDKTLQEPSSKFIDILLSGQGKVAGRDHPIADDKNKINH